MPKTKKPKAWVPLTPILLGPTKAGQTGGFGEVAGRVDLKLKGKDRLPFD